MLSFHVVEVVMELFPDPSGLAAQFTGDVFEILSKYFPVYFTHGVGNGLDTTQEDLSIALMHVFCSTQFFEPFVIPLLLDKLSSSLPLAKFDSLKYLDKCIRFYGADRMVRHASTVWYKLKEVIFNLSLDQLLISEALNCLKTAIMYTDSSDKDLFINLILLDEDIVNKIHSVSSVEKTILSSLEDLSQLHALGSVISILAESSTYFCTRVLQEHFAHLVDIVGTKADYESWQLNNCNGSSSAPVNYGALYLSVQLLSSCREVALVSYEDFSSVKLAKGSWWLILQKKLEQLIHLFRSIFTIASQSMQPNFRQEYVSCASKLTSYGPDWCLKGLLTLATFPEQYINQVLAYAQQSRERANKEQASLVERMHEYKRQIDRETRSSINGLNDSYNGDGIQTIGRSSHKQIEAVMQSTSKGKVQTIRQGYLSKRSSNLRADWKRRFFVLDSRGMLYYYRKQITRPPVGLCCNIRC
ncbi:MMS19 nucleotide excision repair protein-like protein [Zea mays]|uniref:MMS19 nucleotide excision repair protein n=1 Tax=Zea mays TaxID=4577 RepID=A0A1D6IAK2_MAIZE|nr:MMS19 nucleotide excision repair protein-like protein [Zea mays]